MEKHRPSFFPPFFLFAGRTILSASMRSCLVFLAPAPDLRHIENMHDISFSWPSLGQVAVVSGLPLPAGPAKAEQIATGG
jgi:hypothetical protein